MNNKTGLLLVLLCLCWPGAAVAAEAEIDCSVSAYEGSLFSAIHEAAKETGTVLCKKLLIDKTLDEQGNDRRFQNSLAEYSRISRAVIFNLQLNQIAGVEAQVNAMVERLSSGTRDFPEFVAQRKFGSGLEGFFTAIDAGVARFDIPKTHPVCSNLLPGKGCAEVFEELQMAFNAYRQPFDTFTNATNSWQLDKLGDDWDRFLEVSKSQTAVEVFLTTWAQRDHFRKDHLVGPPRYQIVALHPQIIYESLGDADSGDQLKAGIALEWIGVNFWDAKIPFGISLTRVYVDRKSASAYGNGVMLHFDNRYSIGFADHGGDESVFVTIDLLKLIENEKANLEQYLD